MFLYCFVSDNLSFNRSELFMQMIEFDNHLNKMNGTKQNHIIVLNKLWIELY